MVGPGGRSWTAGAYVTDGRRLFREDCRTLVVGAYTAEELWHMALRRVENGVQRGS
jgi:hypothetical protein